MKRFLLYIAAICILITGLTSCQALFRTYFGIKKFREAYTKEERLEYYKPFYDNKDYKTELYSMADTAALHLMYKSFHVPRVLLQNKVTDSVYVLDCYEDIAENIKNINNHKPDGLHAPETPELEGMKVVLSSNKVIKQLETGQATSGQWNAYIINTIFMGKPLRKRTLAVTGLNGLESLTILDVSVDKKTQLNY